MELVINRRKVIVHDSERLHNVGCWGIIFSPGLQE